MESGEYLLDFNLSRMKNNEINKQIERILDEWDPIGILQDIKPINYEDDSIGEYGNYVLPIIQVFIENRSVYDYLITLHTNLRDDPNEYIKEEIKLVAERIVNFLSQYDVAEIKESR